MVPASTNQYPERKETKTRAVDGSLRVNAQQQQPALKATAQCSREEVEMAGTAVENE
jgi:hypothetical protein